MRFLKDVPVIMLAPAMVGVAAVLLSILGAAPGWLAAMADNDYASIADAESAVGFEIVLPVYFPSYLSLPPARIRADTTPRPFAETVYLSADDGSEILVIYQAVGNGNATLEPLRNIRGEPGMRVAMNGNEGQLLTGVHPDGRKVNAVEWQDSGWRFAVLTTQPERELLRIARSIHPRQAPPDAR